MYYGSGHGPSSDSFVDILANVAIGRLVPDVTDLGLQSDVIR